MSSLSQLVQNFTGFDGVYHQNMGGPYQRGFNNNMEDNSYIKIEYIVEGMPAKIIIEVDIEEAIGEV